MKKQYPASHKAKAGVSYHKHLHKDEERRVNKSTRKIAKEELRKEILAEELL